MKLFAGQKAKRIYKYEIQLIDEFEIEMPEGSIILSVQSQNNFPVMWALVFPDVKTYKRKFKLVGTGRSIDNWTCLNYVGTFQLDGGAFIGHLFEILG